MMKSELWTYREPTVKAINELIQRTGEVFTVFLSHTVHQARRFPRGVGA
jgi:hypothetical protein